TPVTPSVEPFAAEEANSALGQGNAGRMPALPVTPALPPATLPPLGIHLLLDDGRNQWPIGRWAEHMRYARDMTGRGGYVTELVRLDDLDLGRWQRFMDLCAELELTPV